MNGRGLRERCGALGAGWLASVVIGLGAYAATPTVLYVDDDAFPGGNGLTWLTAYKHVQDAIDHAAMPGATIETICVAGGVYKPDRSVATPGGTGDRAATFEIGADLTLRGGYAGLSGPDPNAQGVMKYETVLTGDLAGDDDPPTFGNYCENSRHVVTMNGGATLEGVTVTGGNADEPGFGQGGGGILIPFTIDEFGDVTVHDCAIVRNLSATYGGGLLQLPDVQLTITRTLVLLNEAAALGGGAATYAFVETVVGDSVFEGNRGGGLHAEFGWLDFDGCAFVSNQGSGLSYGSDSRVTAVDCRFKGNTTSGRGGAIFAGFESSSKFVNCSFRGNEAYEGGAIWNDSNLPMELANCAFVGNVSDTRGGAISCLDTNIYVRNCTLAGNQAYEGGGIFSADQAYVDTFEIDNSVLWYNEAMIGAGHQITLGAGLPFGSSVGVSVSVTISDLQGHVNDIHVDPDVPFSNVYADYVMDAEPQFIGGTSGMTPDEWAYASVRPKSTSPVVDRGWNGLIPPDELDIDGDGDTTEPVPLDLDRRDRVVDAAGFGFAYVDLGAYEWQFCQADLDNSGAVGFADLGRVLAMWGACAGCAEDFNANGKVGFEDLSYLLANWGACS